MMNTIETPDALDIPVAKKSKGPLLVTIAIVLMATGFIFMIQPFVMFLYTIGFPIILAGVILINVGSHM
jgi:hypothetical protein